MANFKRSTQQTWKLFIESPDVSKKGLPDTINARLQIDGLKGGTDAFYHLECHALNLPNLLFTPSSTLTSLRRSSRTGCKNSGKETPPGAARRREAPRGGAKRPRRRCGPHRKRTMKDCQKDGYLMRGQNRSSRLLRFRLEIHEFRENLSQKKK